MNTKFKAAVAALVFSAFVAQPITANATPAATAVTPGLGAFWVLGFIACTAITLRKQDRDAGTSMSVSDRARLHAVLGCAFPPLGFALLHHPKRGYDR